MTKIIYIPLDERPCNYLFPNMIGEMSSQINIITPPKDILSKKKNPADIDKLWEWVFKNAQSSEYAILSLEMLLYGGLLPSRLHNYSIAELEKRVHKIKELKNYNKNIKIYLSNLIMRTPKYSSSDEEPDYYEEWGKEIFTIEYLKDKKERVGIDNDEEIYLSHLEKNIPEQYLKDYSERRSKNLKITEMILNLVKENLIEFLVIPQDDSSEFGFTAKDQKIIYEKIAKENLQIKVHVYPGADEVGCTLLARVYTKIKNTKIKIYPYFSSEIGKVMIPSYEDRPLLESLKSHIIAAGAIMVDSYKDADFVLAVNTAGKIMQEAWDNDRKDISYSTFRNMREFISKIEFYIENEKKVIVADSAFSNGGETELIQLLEETKLLDKIKGYAGWNTNCNTLGTAICTGIFAVFSDENEKIEWNKLCRIFEDWMYQSIIRKEITDNTLKDLKLNYFDLKDKKAVINKMIQNKMLEIYKKTFTNSFNDILLDSIEIDSPWNRMFEIEINLKIKKIS
ncbi:DUF4127 family protein [Cetobacterium sp.]|uniref:DUF4127 family protein n=2 Tax=Cetobacterium sp. TaxID=2071632 RepID=UPI003EE613DA